MRECLAAASEQDRFAALLQTVLVLGIGKRPRVPKTSSQRIAAEHPNNSKDTVSKSAHAPIETSANGTQLAPCFFQAPLLPTQQIVELAVIRQPTSGGETAWLPYAAHVLNSALQASAIAASAAGKLMSVSS